AQMIAEAKQLFPEIDFQQGDMLNFDKLEDGKFVGIAAFYCIIHIEPEKLIFALKELARILAPNGVLLVTYHVGDEIRHLDEWWEQQVNLDFRFYETVNVKGALQAAGF